MARGDKVPGGVVQDGGIFETFRTPLFFDQSSLVWRSADGRPIDKGAADTLIPRWNAAQSTPQGRNAIAMTGLWTDKALQVLEGLPEGLRTQNIHAVAKSARDAYLMALSQGKSEKEAQTSAESTFQSTMAETAARERVPYNPAPVVTPQDDPVNPGAAPQTALSNADKANEQGIQGVRDLRDKFLNERDTTKPVYVPPIAVPQVQKDSEFRRQQLANLDMVNAAARGEGPSVAQNQLKAQLHDTNQNAIGLAAAGDAGSRRMATRTLSDNARKAGLDAALVGAKEQTDARQQLIDAAGQGRTQDTTVDTGNADRTMLGSTKNADNVLAAKDIQVKERQGLGELGLGSQQTETQTANVAAQIANLKEQLKLAYATLAQAKDQAEKDRQAKIITSLISALGALGGQVATG